MVAFLLITCHLLFYILAINIKKNLLATYFINTAYYIILKGIFLRKDKRWSRKRFFQEGKYHKIKQLHELNFFFKAYYRKVDEKVKITYNSITQV